MTLGAKDTIAAQATPSGVGGIGIIRVSGLNLEPILKGVLGIPSLKPRYAHFGDFLDQNGHPIDQGITLYFKAPHSFTGEDVLEFQGHGGPVVMRRLLRRILELGAVMARPGEFSERAFLNGKIDLTKAEAICDLIEAQSELAAESAVRSLQGAFSSTIHQLVDDLIELRKYVEVAIDFSDEEVDFLPKDQISRQIEALLQRLLTIKKMARQGVVLQHGVNIVIAGPPNSGKSSLLNQLSQKNVAIVTDIPGTTRDILKYSIQIDGLCFQVMDTAGIRDQTMDSIELEGINRARTAIKESDHVLLVLDITQAENWRSWEKEIPAKTQRTLVLNKMDLISKKIAIEAEYPVVYISAKTGEGIESLMQHIKQCVGLTNVPENQFTARDRHIEALNRAESYLLQGRQQTAYELIAEELKQTQQALSEITGVFCSDDLLDKIFGSFCIGK